MNNACRQAISTRTKEALAAAKARGVRLGNPNGAKALQRAAKGNVASVGVIKRKADRHAEQLQPVIGALAEEGIASLGPIAEALNERGMLTPRSGRWHKSSVRNLLTRLQSDLSSNSVQGLEQGKGIDPRLPSSSRR